MDENSKMKILANDLTRRLLNTSESLGLEDRVKVVNDYSQKLLNSGYGQEQVRRIIINGIKSYERKFEESMRAGGRKLHRTSGESSGLRNRKKLLDKSEWFKRKRPAKREEQDDRHQPKPRSGQRCMEQQLKAGPISHNNLQTRSVLFVEQTPGGKLAKDIREVLTRLETLLGFKVKVVERSGTSLRNLMPNTNPWAGARCSRLDCVTCNQECEVNPDLLSIPQGCIEVL